MFKRFSAGFAAGYVLGARAGRERYEQITEAANRATELPLIGAAAERASELFTVENGSRLVRSLIERAGYGSSSDDDDRDDERDDDSDDDGGDGRVRRMASTARARGRAG